MSKPITRRSIRPITRRVPNPEELRRATIQRVMAERPEAPNPLETRLRALEQKVEALLARKAPPSIDEIAERALETRLDQIAATIEAAAAERAIEALDPKVEEMVAAKARCSKPSIDPRTILELVDQRLKEALEHRFRAMLGHLENEVIPRVLKKSASSS